MFCKSVDMYVDKSWVLDIIHKIRIICWLKLWTYSIVFIFGTLTIWIIILCYSLWNSPFDPLVMMIKCWNWYGLLLYDCGCNWIGLNTFRAEKKMVRTQAGNNDRCGGFEAETLFGLMPTSLSRKPTPWLSSFYFYPFKVF